MLFPILGFFVFVVGPIVLLGFGWLAAGLDDNGQWHVSQAISPRTLLFTIAALMAVVCFLTVWLASPQGTAETILIVLAFLALFAELSPFAIGWFSRQETP